MGRTFLLWGKSVMEFTVADLNQKSLYRLREIGTQVGVKAPTAKNKQDLILSIMDVVSGRVQPTVSKVGRPRKNFVDNEIDEKLEQKIQDLKVKQLTEREIYEVAVDKMVERIRNFLLLQFDKI